MSERSPSRTDSPLCKSYLKTHLESKEHGPCLVEEPVKTNQYQWDRKELVLVFTNHTQALPRPLCLVAVTHEWEHCWLTWRRTTQHCCPPIHRRSAWIIDMCIWSDAEEYTQYLLEVVCVLCVHFINICVWRTMYLTLYSFTIPKWKSGLAQRSRSGGRLLVF